MIDFSINQAVIAKTLCVQKEDQQGCNGKCQLVKSLKTDLNQNTETPIVNENKLAVYLYIQPINEFNISLNEIFKTTKKFDNVNYNIIQKYYTIITPPPLA